MNGSFSLHVVIDDGLGGHFLLGNSVREN